MTTWTPIPLPPGVPREPEDAFVGRAQHLAHFEALWPAVLEERRQAVLIGGEPGVGKTRLAAHVARTLHQHGTAVLWGACHPELELPYLPVATALQHLFAAAEDGALSPIAAGSASQLARLAPNVRLHCPPAAVIDGGERDPRLLLFDGVLDLLLSLAERQPVVMVVEDLHWASTPTLQLLAHLIQSTSRGRLLFIGTYRTTYPDRTDQLTYALADVYRHDGVSRVDLDGLDTEEITDYLMLVAAMPRPAARGSAAVLRDQTGGNAFFLRELWRELSPRGGVETLRSPTFAAPRTVRDTIAGRLSHLADAHADVIELAAVFGVEFDLSVLLEASEHPRSVTLEAVDLGIDLGLFAGIEAEPGCYRFLHTLARQAVLDGTPPSRRVTKHARIAVALEPYGGDRPEAVAKLAHHFDRAHALGYAEQAVAWLARAAEQAEASLAYEQAAEMYTRAADLPTGGPLGREALLFRAARNRMLAGDFAAARPLYEQLSKSSDPEILMRAAIGYEDASWRPGHHGDHAVHLLSEALRRWPSDEQERTHIRALASLGRALSFVGAADRAREVGDAALARARDLRDDGLLAHALATTLWVRMTPTQAPVVLRRAVELSRLGDQTRDHDHLGQASFHRAVSAYLLGLPDEWDIARTDLRRSARLGGQPFFRYMAGCCDYGRDFAQGAFDAAGETVAALDKLGRDFGPDTTEGSYGVQTFMLRRVTGGLDHVRFLVDGSEDVATHWAPGLLALYTELGMWPSAARLLADLVEQTDAYGEKTSYWTAVLAFMVEAAVALGDRSAAARLRPLVATYSGCNFVAGQFVAVFGSADRYLGMLDSLLREPTADEHFESALEMDRRMGALTHQVETLTAWARHAARDTAGRAAQQRLAAEARVIAQRIGHRRAFGTHVTSGNPVPTLPDGLTERELDVLRLVAAGLSNREIGRALFISQNTAANHVRSILVKTGAANRTQAAIYASARDLLDGTPDSASP